MINTKNNLENRGCFSYANIGCLCLFCKKFNTAALNSFAFSMEQTWPHFLIIYKVDFERDDETFLVPSKKHRSSSPETKNVFIFNCFNIAISLSGCAISEIYEIQDKNILRVIFKDSRIKIFLDFA